MIPNLTSLNVTQFQVMGTQIELKLFRKIDCIEAHDSISAFNMLWINSKQWIMVGLGSVLQKINGIGKVK